MTLPKENDNTSSLYQKTLDLNSIKSQDETIINILNLIDLYKEYTIYSRYICNFVLCNNFRVKVTNKRHTHFIVRAAQTHTVTSPGVFSVTLDQLNAK